MKPTSTELHARGAAIIEAQRIKHSKARTPGRHACDTCGAKVVISGSRFLAYRCEECCKRIGKKGIGKPRTLAPPESG